MLIAKRARPDPDALASPDIKLKKLLACSATDCAGWSASMK
jgi:hypothetical protein